MPEFFYGLKIPKERVAVLIGTHGQVKKYIEEETDTNIRIDSKLGDVEVRGEDALSLYSTMEIIKAIGRGFNPEIAQLLLRQDYCFELISLHDFVKPTQLRRIKGRVIGKDGRARRNIEHLTQTFISVYGKTIGIIGRNDHVGIARRAITSLIKGSPHANVYRWLEKMRREQKRREYEDKQAF